ncbi:amylopullulanase precursor [Andreesenia angusta]|uniref:Amylopullulanase n=2 Tax=Andreesenia angusta TaxID=39480 RepID=A0A1S1VCA3_9FIRM|nr:amylopullulanase precursor [Andreesenia angusta]
MMEIAHDSHSLDYRSPFGAVKSGDSVELKLRLTTDRQMKAAYIVINRDREAEKLEKMSKISAEGIEEVYGYELYTSNFRGLVWYYFEVHTDEGVYYYGNSNDGLGGVGSMYIHSPKSYQITVYSPDGTVPCWYREGVIYQIFPDRFYNGNPGGKVNRPNRDMLLRADWSEDPSYIKDESGRVVYYDYFGGNLLGVIEKLDYLEDLGVSIIYLNPIFEASSNHKYDTGDYMKIDKMFGDEEKFKTLCEKARERGIYIVLDGVFSHTGSDSIYFNKYGNYNSTGAYQSKDSKYYSWYRFKTHPDEYESWWGIDVLPNVEEENSSYKEFILGDGGVIEKWTKLGAKGWRLDVADELPDSFIKSLRKKLKEVDEDSVLIGEVWEDSSNKISYGERREYLLGEELDSTMNYPFRDNFERYIMGEINSYEVHRNIMSLYENYPKEYFYSAMNLIGTHDSERAIYAFGRVPDPNHMTEAERKEFRMTPESRKDAIDHLKMASLVQMTFPGVPSIYYGDEVGVEGYADPHNRRTYPWGREDEELLSWYKKVIAIRKSHSVFRWGDFKSIPVNRHVYGYMRKNSSLGLVLLNRCERSQQVELDLSEYGIERLKDLIEEKEYSLEDGVLKIEICPRGRLVLLNEKQAHA